MKRQINFKKLARLKVVQIVEPSENMKIAYLEKVESSLLSSKILFKNKQFLDSLVLAYFSMYNSSLALLYRCGIKSENHNATISILNKVFGIDTSGIEKIKEDRKNRQYYPSFSVSEKDSLGVIKIVEEFNVKLKDFMSRINLKDISEYRNKFREMLR